MARFLKLLVVVIIVAAVAGSSAYVVMFTDITGGDGSTEDTASPQITSITGNTTGTTGHTTRIEAAFTDDTGVTAASLFYRMANTNDWTNVSMMQGWATISIPNGQAVNFQYYVTVMDAAGNEARSPSGDDSSFYTITVTHQNVTVVHHVFIEEATYTGCAYCPTMAENLRTLEESNGKSFSYVAYVNDMNKEAKDRTNALGMATESAGYPAIFIDGGYRILVGGTTTKDQIADAIKDAAGRDVPPIQLIITSTNTSNKATITVNMTNYGGTSYTGLLRVFVTDRSAWEYYGNQGNYHYGLTDILAADNVTIPAYGQLLKTYSITAAEGSDFNNTAILAAIYSHTGSKVDSNPAGDPFTAYYVDASNMTLVYAQGSLPPTVGITFPIGYSINIMNHQILKSIKPFKFITCIGRPTIKANATAGEGSTITRVEFYIDGKLIKNLTAAPYNFKWPVTKISFGLMKHKVSVIAYDSKNRNATISESIRVFGI